MARHYRPFPRSSHGPTRALRIYRISRGWTQTQLGDLIGVSQFRISHIEQGRLVPDAQTRTKIAQVFGVPASEIFPELEDVPS